MNQERLQLPERYGVLMEKSSELEFSMASDRFVGSMLKTLVAAKPKGNFLELGTGTGLSLAWMVEGMCKKSQLTTIDNDPELTNMADTYFGNDDRVNIICGDAGTWINEYRGEPFDLIFADAWPGKYADLDGTLALLSKGGFYVIDDMLPQKNWPIGHEDNAARLIRDLETKKDLVLTKMNWSTGIIVAVKN